VLRRKTTNLGGNKNREQEQVGSRVIEMVSKGSEMVVGDDDVGNDTSSWMVKKQCTEDIQTTLK
jgi:hypothetical protein